jgi:hypothetical protein
MPIIITREQMENKKFYEAQKKLAEAWGMELIVETPVQKPKHYDCTIWTDENTDIAYGEFDTKAQARKWACENLARYPRAIADLKHWNAKHDDYGEYWFLKLENGKLTETEWGF